MLLHFVLGGESLGENSGIRRCFWPDWREKRRENGRWNEMGEGRAQTESSGWLGRERGRRRKNKIVESGGESASQEVGGDAKGMKRERRERRGTDEERRWKKTEVSVGSFKRGINHFDSLSVSLSQPCVHACTHTHAWQHEESQYRKWAYLYQRDAHACLLLSDFKILRRLKL